MFGTSTAVSAQYQASAAGAARPLQARVVRDSQQLQPGWPMKHDVRPSSSAAPERAVMCADSAESDLNDVPLLDSEQTDFSRKCPRSLLAIDARVRHMAAPLNDAVLAVLATARTAVA